ncbi:CAMK/CAMKL/AMPK protein kinase Ppk9 [Schizosaccharomyces cryophilus OY26]|uniref:CAMK/CAMKL/AMPK protein kinase Ppk9 n=1 Tax=Schizosaccharomyces cryophilus (strain OY26 / ATCC MYA-4695 / CBS 11777 / NBRC 106824 / NRRL Y48691) TaxID=653667 RepID=S9VYX6_SCHCR|nr:CAMK/CAMKL/AMPK protein kinase Ppk9 [Schizosaccharomyces cryophilus OY26]EPY51025.1 CAMK/CAMKL/AMPK protein kinase Ppk9 [Schizosaccharomyces cryophilus OY26]
MQTATFSSIEFENVDVSQFIGPWKLGRTLGEGNLAKVKLGIHSETEEKVALKMIRNAELEDETTWNHVLREVMILRSFRHPNIISLYQVLRVPKYTVLALEFMETDLHSMLARCKRLNEAVARRIFQQVVFAIEYCHQNNVSHRDLKLENILVSNSLTVKLSDFSLSNFMYDGSFLRTSCGTPHYAAPEVIQGRYYDGCDVDIWGCGILLYLMLVGEFPFEDVTISNVLSRACKGIYTVPSHVSSGATDLIRQMLTVIPTDRIKISDIIQHPWFVADNLPSVRLSSHSTFFSEKDHIVNFYPAELAHLFNSSLTSSSVSQNNSQLQSLDLSYLPVYASSNTDLSSSADNLSFQLFPCSDSHPNSLSYSEKKDPSGLVTPPSKASSESHVNILPTSLPSEHATYMSKMYNIHGFHATISTRLRKFRWHYGIQTNKSPREILLQLCQSLQLLGASFRPYSTEDFLRENKYRVDAKINTDSFIVYLTFEIFSLGSLANIIDIRFSGNKASAINNPVNSPMPCFEVVKQFLRKII